MRALAQIDTPHDDVNHDDVVFFDVFAAVIVRWPSSWAIPLALVAAMFIVVAALLLRSRQPTGSTPRSALVAWVALAWLGTLVLAFLAGEGLLWLLGEPAEGQSLASVRRRLGRGLVASEIL